MCWASSIPLQRKSSTTRALMSSSSVGVSWRPLISWKLPSRTESRAGRLTQRDWAGVANKSVITSNFKLALSNKDLCGTGSNLCLDFLGTQVCTVVYIETYVHVWVCTPHCHIYMHTCSYMQPRSLLTVVPGRYEICKCVLLILS